ASGKPLTAQQLAEYGLDNPQLASNEQGDTMTDVGGGIDSDAEVQGATGAAFDTGGTNGTDTASMADASGAMGGKATGDGSSGNYTIQKGDTLSELAQKFGTTTEALAAANNIDNPDLIHTGAELVVPGLSDVAPLSNDFVGPPTLAEYTAMNQGGVSWPGYSPATMNSNQREPIPAQTARTPGSSLPKGAITHNFELGAEGKDVRKLQNKLFSFGYRDISRTGKFDLNTAASYQQYKTEVGRGIWNISEDGKHDLNTKDVGTIPVRVLHGEASGQTYPEKVAVASVMKNRVEETRFDFKRQDTYEKVVLEKNQFDAIKHDLYKENINPNNLDRDERAAYYESGRALLNVAGGYEEDPTDGALFYYTPDTKNYPNTGGISPWFKKQIDSGVLKEELYVPGVDKNNFRFFHQTR
ncbi:MAG: LysM peptidoglycan-binding domain-containing protein, partial [Gammaproteobacteria bacterium]|nr:LysM peptidoglycan-binding domain-containing protein [Gammaproteobacteria bacterium]